MRTFVAILVSFTCLFFVSCVSDAIEDEALKVRVGDKIPSFEIVMLDGKVFSTSQMQGKTYLVMFFSTTCPDCQRQLPEVDKAYRQLSRPDAVIAISRAEAADVVAPFWQDHAFLLPVAATTDHSLYQQFAMQGVPRLYFVDYEGRIKYMSDDKTILTDAEILSLLNP